MEILDIYVDNTNLTVVVDFDVDSSETTMIGVDNAENYHSNVASNKHDLLYTECMQDGNEISVTLPSKTSALIVITLYANNTKILKMYLNKYMLFKAQNAYLINLDIAYKRRESCSECVQKCDRMTALAVLLRSRLLDFAYENNLINDAIQFYIDLCRVLDLSKIKFESIPQFYNNIDAYVTALL